MIILTYFTDPYKISKIRKSWWSGEKLNIYIPTCTSHMANKWLGGNLLWRVSTYKFTQPFKHKVIGGYVTNYKHFSTITMPMVTRFVRLLTYCQEFPPINLHDPSMLWSCEVAWQIKYTCRRPMNTKLSKVLTQRYRLLPLTNMKSRNNW